MELDSHADTCTVGLTFQIMLYTEKSCNVTPYHPRYEGINNFPIAQAAAAYTDDDTRATYILIIKQAVYVVDELNNALINPCGLMASLLTIVLDILHQIQVS